MLCRSMRLPSDVEGQLSKRVLMSHPLKVMDGCPLGGEAVIEDPTGTCSVYCIRYGHETYPTTSSWELVT
jgi:hypothetical protein